MTKARTLGISVVLVAALAWAKANIVVDGQNTDWASTTTCEQSLGNGTGGIKLSRVCEDNNNDGGNSGYFFALFEADGGFPATGDRYFGFEIDTNNDGVINSSDEVWAAHFVGTATAPSNLSVYDPVTFNLRRSYLTKTNCYDGGSPNGWDAYQNTNHSPAPKALAELKIAYACLGLSAGNDNRLMELGVYPNFDTTALYYYDGTNSTLTAAGPPPDVISFTATSGPFKNELFWTNPSLHEGVLVLRGAGVRPNTAPTNQTGYTLGQTLGNAKVAYVDQSGSSVSALNDAPLDAGVRYFYKVYNHHQHFTYSAGNAPSSNGLFSDPTTDGGEPIWCYSVGFPTLQQPSTELNTAVYTASNGGAFTASQTLPGSSDGWERWRPLKLPGAVQMRASLLPLVGRTGNWAVVGDQTGVVSLISTANATIAWQTASLGQAIQAQPGAMLYAFADARFQAAQPNRDVIFVGTHNTSSHINNKVYGLSSVNGSAAWTYAPNNLDWVTGEAVDYANDRLYVASYSNGGAQNSLRVLSTLDGSALYQFNLGDLPYGVNLRAPGAVYTEAVAINGTGTVSGYTLTADGGTPTQKWSFATGSAPTAYAFPLSTGFITPLSNGSVRRYDVVEPVDGGVTTVTQKWSSAVTGPSGVWIDYTHSWLYVGSTDGRLRQLDMNTGAVLHQVYVTDGGAVGTPTIDTTASRVHVGTADGRLCAFPNPLQ